MQIQEAVQPLPLISIGRTDREAELQRSQCDDGAPVQIARLTLDIWKRNMRLMETETREKPYSLIDRLRLLTHSQGGVSGIEAAHSDHFHSPRLQ